MLTLYRRHKPTCPQFGQPRGMHNKCKCAIWADGVLGREEIRRSMRTRDWTKANREVQKWEAEEKISEHGAPVTLAYAWESLLADLDKRGLTGGTVRKYKLLKKQMSDYAIAHSLTRLADFDLDTLDRFRRTWKDGPRTALKKLERLRAFFRFAVDRAWIEKNPARRLSNPRVELRPTMPLSDAEMTSILTACDSAILTAMRPAAKLNALRLKTLVLLMRYSGMRVSDAVALEKSKLDGNRLFLRTQKTGQPVYTILPPLVVDALATTPRITDSRYFWSGQGTRESVTCHWQMRLKELFDAAGIKKDGTNALSHRFRDTFAVKLLERGTSIESVSVLLGHKSIRITEKHYSPWVRSRQEALEVEMKNAWKGDATLKQASTNQVQARGSVN
jgi:integrase/recombinase XerD